MCLSNRSETTSQLKKADQLDKANSSLGGIAVLKAGLLAFTVCFLGHLLSDPAAAYQSDVCSALDRAVMPGQRLVGALPREHAKTTLGTVALTLREICRGYKKNIMIIGANQDEASAKLRLVVNELETNEKLATTFNTRLGPARDIKGQLVAYGDTEVILTGGTRITTLGFGGRIRGQLAGGRRLDLVILDDPEDDSSVASPTRRMKQRDWFDRALVNALDANDGSLVWLGTLLHHDSILAQLIKDKQGLDHWQVFCRAAITESGQPLWPGRWSIEKLNGRRLEIGERAFAQEFMNRPASIAEQLFTAGCFKSYDPAGLRVRDAGVFLDGNQLEVFMAVDPAIGQASHHDHFAAAVIGVAPDLRVFLLDMLKGRFRFSDQLGRLQDLAKVWKPRLIGVEAVAYQAALSHGLVERGLPVRQLKATIAKLTRIETVAACADRGQLYLPLSGPWVAGFREEAEQYPHGKHDDQLDALAGALKLGLENVGRYGSIEAGGQVPKREFDDFSPGREQKWTTGF